MNLVLRGIAVLLLLSLERFLLTFLVVSERAQSSPGFPGALWAVQHWGFRFAVTFVMALTAFAYVKGDPALSQVDAEARRTRLSASWLSAHAVLIVVVALLIAVLYDGNSAALPFSLLAYLVLFVSLAAVAALVAAAAPWSLWFRAAGALGSLWAYALLAAAAATYLMQRSQTLWSGEIAAVTFSLVHGLLVPLIPHLQADPSRLILDTGRFAVQINGYCSGLEGMGLMLVFCCAWLVYFRHEYIFPRALSLIPLGLAAIFLFNVVRIAALVLIGHAGFPEVATYGFHSSAGWIAFNIAGGTIAFVSRGSHWLNRNASPSVSHEGDNPTAAYLVPFLSILAAGMLARAASSGFETLYVLRLLAAAVALYAYRDKLKELAWRISWRGPLLGAVVFGIWIGYASFLTTPDPMPDTLAEMSPGGRSLWIAVRIAATVLTVPVAEELAYRGYLMRRLVSRDFEAIQFGTVGIWALLASSVVFGLGHGSMWLPATIAGVIYGTSLVFTQRIGEAAAAHATTNALLAAYVLLGQQWQLW